MPEAPDLEGELVGLPLAEALARLRTLGIPADVEPTWAPAGRPGLAGGWAYGRIVRVRVSGAPPRCELVVAVARPGSGGEGDGDEAGG